MKEESAQRNTIADGKRWRWLQRLTIPLLALAGIGGGLAVWDHYDYPVKGFGHVADPFGDSYCEPPFDKLGDTLYQFRRELYSRKTEWIHKRRLQNLKLAGTTWAFCTNDPPHEFGTIEFHKNGTVFISPHPGAAHQPWFSATTFTFERETQQPPPARISFTQMNHNRNGIVIFKSSTSSHRASINIRGNGDFSLSIQSRSGPSSFDYTSFFLTPLEETTAPTP